MKVLNSALAVVATATILSPVGAKSGPKLTAYVEVNNDPISSVGRYTLADGSNAFDFAVIFAANVNYNGTAAVLYNNPQTQTVLDNAQTTIRPLQAKGIKVLLSVLGNHQGVGISNFRTQAAAADFAGQLRDAVRAYGLDGIDLDDEYADYGTKGQPQANSQSIGWLLAALRTDLPDKLITFYNYGPASTYLSAFGATAGSKLDYAWNAQYGTYSVPGVRGLTKAKLAPAAVQVTSTSQSDAVSFAKRTVSDGYGAYMTYALPGDDRSVYISAITQALYGQKTTFK